MDSVTVACCFNEIFLALSDDDNDVQWFNVQLKAD